MNLITTNSEIVMTTINEASITMIEPKTVNLFLDPTGRLYSFIISLIEPRDKKTTNKVKAIEQAMKITSFISNNYFLNICQCFDQFLSNIFKFAHRLFHRDFNSLFIVFRYVTNQNNHVSFSEIYLT